MTGLAERAEQIAAHLVGHETGAAAVAQGRQAPIDFLLQWPDGRVGALEVTLVTQSASVAWQGLAMKDGWRWHAESSWEFRPWLCRVRLTPLVGLVRHHLVLDEGWSVGFGRHHFGGVLPTVQGRAASCRVVCARR